MANWKDVSGDILSESTADYPSILGLMNEKNGLSHDIPIALGASDLEVNYFVVAFGTSFLKVLIAVESRILSSFSKNKGEQIYKLLSEATG